MNKVPAEERYCPECNIRWTVPEHDEDTNNYRERCCPQCLAMGVKIKS